MHNQKTKRRKDTASIVQQLDAATQENTRLLCHSSDVHLILRVNYVDLLENEFQIQLYHALVDLGENSQQG